jgi:ADP-heptose:LPS heptosyltransferase
MALHRNILIFHQGALGDFVVTWPLALGLGRVYAQSRVFYVTASQKGALAERALRVESVDVEGGWHQLFSQNPKLPEPALKLVEGARCIISFVAGPESLWWQNVKQLAPEAELVSLLTKPSDQLTDHVTRDLLTQLKPWPVLEAAMDQMLKSAATRGIGGAAGDPNGPVVLHPGAGSEKKCWPAEQFVELASQLSQAGRTVEVILGEVELERWPASRIEAFTRCASVQRPSTLVALMDRLLKAAAFVGNDSGPGHLAGILGTPTYCVFGLKDPTGWRPLGPKVQIVQGEWAQISPGSVFNQLQKTRGST